MNTSVESLTQKGSRWFPESASTLSNDIDLLFYVVIYGSIIISLGIFIVGGYWLYKYKRTKDNQIATDQITHNTTLEVLWTVIPFILVMILFAWGYKDYLRLVIPPENAQEIRVTGKKWFWEFDYPKSGKKLTNEFYVPVNTPIKLVMSSTDVIHSFFIPNFRVKKDVLPNKYSRLWFEATKTGTFQVFCTEYCGDQHSNMLAVVHVLSESDYNEWLASSTSTDDIPLEELGQKLYKSKACAGCHSLDGVNAVGPTWKGLYGSTKELMDGSTAKADDNYLRESIVNPNAKVVKGYAPVMPTYAGSLTDREIDAIIEYIRGIK